MSKMNFTEISSTYEKNSMVQRSAADILIDLLAIKEKDDVLDLGCGTGHLTRKLREMTGGRVVGVDPSPGMIQEAKRENIGKDMSFKLAKAEEMDYQDAFDVIFCNSSLQWFKEPKLALDNCYRVLRNRGRLGIQAPATRTYSPNFIQAVEMVGADPRTKKTFASFNNPWLFFETAQEYAFLFEQSGFEVTFSLIEKVQADYTAEEVFRIFESGAAAGYLNQNYYDLPVDSDYIEAFKEIVKSAFNGQSKEGRVKLVFNRIYLVAVKG